MSAYFVGLGPFVMCTFIGAIMLALFMWGYMWVTPCDEWQLIREKRMAPAVSLSAATFGFSIPLVAALHASVNVVDFIIWGTIGGLIQIVVFKVAYLVIPGMRDENNAPAAVVYGSISIAFGLLQGFAKIPW